MYVCEQIRDEFNISNELKIVSAAWTALLVPFLVINLVFAAAELPPPPTVYLLMGWTMISYLVTNCWPLYRSFFETAQVEWPNILSLSSFTHLMASRAFLMPLLLSTRLTACPLFYSGCNHVLPKVPGARLQVCRVACKYALAAHVTHFSHSVENLLFYLDVEAYKKIEDNKCVPRVVFVLVFFFFGRSCPPFAALPSPPYP